MGAWAWRPDLFVQISHKNKPQVQFLGGGGAVAGYLNLEFNAFRKRQSGGENKKRLAAAVGSTGAF